MDGQLEAAGERVPGPGADPSTGGAVLWTSLQLIAAPMTDVVVAGGVALPALQYYVGDRRDGAVFAVTVPSICEPVKTRLSAGRGV